MKKLIAILVLLLSGCASVGEAVLKAGTTGEVRFEATDVREAINIAVSAQDKAGEACYRAILKHTEAQASYKSVGPVSAYAAGRARVREARAPLAEDVHAACSPLIVDAGSFAARLGFAIGR